MYCPRKFGRKKFQKKKKLKYKIYIKKDKIKKK